MSYFEKIVFKPNEDTFDIAVAELQSFIKSYRQQLQELSAWLQDNPSEKILQWEKINQKPLQSVYPGSLSQLTLNQDLSFLGNGSQVTFDPKAKTITWINQNPILSRDCLQLLNNIQTYKIWRPGSYATHQIGKGAKKQLKTYGWKNINYKKWFKKSSKI